MINILMLALGLWVGYYIGKTGKLPEYIQSLIDKVFKK